MSLADRIDPRCVLIDLQVADSEELFRVVTECLEETGFLEEAERARVRLLDRERIMSTAIAPGVAVPHARCEDSKGVSLSVVRLAGAGIDFGAKDGRPVRLFFVLLGPPEATAEHVKVLGQVAKLIQNRAAIESILGAPDAETMIEAIRSATS